MSEYQYYDFRAIDQGLTAQQQARISNLSSRAIISAYHAQFVYHYGDFHGNIKKLMADDFDIMLYVSNWGTQRLMLRIPETLITISSLKDYFISDALDHYRANKNIILDLHFDDEEGGDWIEGDGMLDDFLPLREEIIQGDYRVLYLAWLKAAEKAMAYDGIDEQTREPKVPAGLSCSTMAQKKYAQWIELDENLIIVAAKKSTAPTNKRSFQPQDYLHYLSVEEKDDFLQRLCKKEANLSATLNRHLQTAYKAKINQTAVDDDDNQRRTFFDLYNRYERRKEQVKEKAKKVQVIRAERQRVEAESQYQTYLDQLHGKEDILWQTIDALIQQGNAKSYDLAAEHLSALYDLAKRENGLIAFMRKTRHLATEYSRRVAFIRRVKAIVDL
jgi:hypothetical protein